MPPKLEFDVGMVHRMYFDRHYFFMPKAWNIYSLSIMEITDTVFPRIVSSNSAATIQIYEVKVKGHSK